MGVGRLVAEIVIEDGKAVAKLREFDELGKKGKSGLKGLGDTAEEAGKKLRHVGDSAKSSTNEVRQFFREDAQGDRVVKEGINSLSGLAFAFTYLTQGEDSATSSTKRLTDTLMTAFAAQNSVEYGMWGLGRSMSGLPGMLGKIGTGMGALGTPISVVIGVGAGLIQFFNESKKAAKEAADEGLKKYGDMLTELAEGAEKWLPEVTKAREAALRMGLDRTEAQLKIYKDMQMQMAAGVKEMFIDADSAMAAGITQVELGKLTKATIEQKVKDLEELQRRTAIQLRLLSTVAEAKKPKLTSADLDTKKEEKVNNKQYLDELYGWMYEAEKKRRDMMRKTREDDVAAMEDGIDVELAKVHEVYVQRLEDVQAYEEEWGDAATAELARASALRRYRRETEEIIKRENEAVITDLLNGAGQFTDAMLSGFQKIGAQGAAEIMRILQLAIKVAQFMNVAEGKGGASVGDFLSLGANFLPFLFASGGYTGNAPSNRPVGMVHGNEIVFESALVDRFGSQLMSLRSQMQKGYAGGGLVGGDGAALPLNQNIRVVGKVDISNGQIALRQWMPEYEKYRGKKLP